jgi:hypothetical protein
MTGDDQTVTIESRPAGWRRATIGSIALVALWCVVWSRENAGKVSAVPVIVAIWTVAWFVNHVYTRWQLRLSPDLVRLERRSPFRKRVWTCRPDEFVVGPIDVVVENGERPGWGAHRFIHLQLANESVRFMQGHRDADLEGVHLKILQWTTRAEPSA